MICAALLALLLIPSVSTAQAPPPRDSAPARDAARPATGTSRIRGRVVDAETGSALRRATVRITGAELREPRVTFTDGEGRYELRDLPKGRYNLMASKSPYVMMLYGQARPNGPSRQFDLLDGQTVERIDFRLPRGGVITGRVLDEFGEPTPDVQITALRNQYTAQGRRPTMGGRFANTNDVGEFRLFGLTPGEYYISATLRGNNPNESTAERTGYAPTYYPATPDLGAAQTITIQAGQTFADAVIMLVPARIARVTGLVVDRANQPVRGGNVMIMSRAAGMNMMTTGSMIRPDGTFTLNGIPPGSYLLRANANGPAPAPNGPPEFSVATIIVDGNDVSNVRVAPIEPVVVTGRVIVDAAAATLPTQTIRVSVNPKNPEDFIPLPNPAPPAAVGEDLTFQTKALPMVVTVGAMLPQGWIVRAVRSDGHDVTSSGLDLRNVTAATIEIEITDRVSQLSGDITDAQGQPAADASIVLFPQDRTVPPTNNRGGTARADADGHFSFRQLLPGSYFAAVVSDVEVGQWMDPEFLETLRQDATAVTLGEAESKTLTLKMR